MGHGKASDFRPHCLGDQDAGDQPENPANRLSGSSSGWGSGLARIIWSLWASAKLAKIQGKNWDRQERDTKAKVASLKWGHQESHRGSSDSTLMQVPRSHL